MLKLRGVNKFYPSGVTALDNVSLEVGDGEFMAILGASGSGKTTLLRIIAGLEEPTDAEEITLDGHSMLGVPAAKRNTATVFQNYALFPHMNVWKNVEYGLRIRKIAKSEREKRVREALEMVQLADKGNRSVDALSGGQRQRVAIARAVVTSPKVLLLDEPLSALDEKLRKEMQEYLVKLHQELKMTFIYITHSQEEALGMSDHVAVMFDGSIVQRSTPETVFSQPISRRVAEFMGYENFIKCQFIRYEEQFCRVSGKGGKYIAKRSQIEPLPESADLTLAIRAENIRIETPSNVSNEDANSLVGKIVYSRYKGKFTHLEVETKEGLLHIREIGAAAKCGSDVRLTWKPDNSLLLSK